LRHGHELQPELLKCCKARRFVRRTDVADGRDMVRIMYLAFLFAAVTSVAVAAKPQGTSVQGGTVRSVPEQYVGSWVCQTFRPGYNLFLPHSTNIVTTPSTVIVQKFSLRADGTYETANAMGHYSFDPATNVIMWLDGPHKEALTQTRLGKRKNGEASVGFVLNRRHYGCFKSK
jgi:hypothetical protein